MSDNPFDDELRHCISHMPTVYPGHPCLLAMQIMIAFPSADAALEKTTDGWPMALTSHMVRGAGGAVYQAVSVIKLLADKPDRPNAAFEHGVALWRASRTSGDHPHKLEKGIRIAEEHHDLFIDMARTWMKHGGEDGKTTRS